MAPRRDGSRETAAGIDSADLRTIHEDLRPRRTGDLQGRHPGNGLQGQFNPGLLTGEDFDTLGSGWFVAFAADPHLISPGAQTADPDLSVTGQLPVTAAIQGDLGAVHASQQEQRTFVRGRGREDVRVHGGGATRLQGNGADHLPVLDAEGMAARSQLGERPAFGRDGFGITAIDPRARAGGARVDDGRLASLVHEDQDQVFDGGRARERRHPGSGKADRRAGFAPARGVADLVVAIRDPFKEGIAGRTGGECASGKCRRAVFGFGIKAENRAPGVERQLDVERLSGFDAKAGGGRLVAFQRNFSLVVARGQGKREV